MLQGARHEHCEAIQHAAHEMNTKVEIIQLRKASDIDDSIQGLVLPGGESTTMRIASQSESLLNGIFTWMINFPNRPVLGTCAGVQYYWQTPVVILPHLLMLKFPVMLGGGKNFHLRHL